MASLFHHSFQQSRTIEEVHDVLVLPTSASDHDQSRGPMSELQSQLPPYAQQEKVVLLGLYGADDDEIGLVRFTRSARLDRVDANSQRRNDEPRNTLPGLVGRFECSS